MRGITKCQREYVVIIKCECETFQDTKKNFETNFAFQIQQFPYDILKFCFVG
jgi:hypothetical protein